MARSSRFQPPSDETPEEFEGGELLDVEEGDGEASPAEAAEATEPRRARQGDQHRPTCPNCSTADKPVLLTAASSPALFTWYVCPTPSCGHRIKVPRPNINQIVGRQWRAEGEDFSAR